jgi:hypothetical protein
MGSASFGRHSPPATWWAKLGWPLDRARSIKRLDELCLIRNNVMHFNPEPLPANTVERLRYIPSCCETSAGRSHR